MQWIYFFSLLVWELVKQLTPSLSWTLNQTQQVALRKQITAQLIIQFCVWASAAVRHFSPHSPLPYHRIKHSEELMCYKNVQSLFTPNYEFLPLQSFKSTS